MTKEACLRSVFLVLSFFSNDDLSKTLLIKFLIGFLRYVFFFSFKTSYFYFKALSILFMWYKTLFLQIWFPLYFKFS